MVNVNKELTKFAALLLFQFRVVKNGKSNKKRICEERIIHLYSETPEIAFHRAQEKGNYEEFDYEDDGCHIFFEFVGIVELVDLAVINSDEEVWSRLIEKVCPIERKDQLIPDISKLSVFRSSKGKVKI